jgi:hypothetical protein
MIADAMLTDLVEVLDFLRSFFTFRGNVSKRPPVTVSHRCPFKVNNARIQIDCLVKSTNSGGLVSRLILCSL